MSEAAISAKSEIVSQIKDKLSRAKSVVIVDYRGLTVSEVTELRRRCGVQGAQEHHDEPRMRGAGHHGRGRASFRPQCFLLRLR